MLVLSGVIGSRLTSNQDSFRGVLSSHVNDVVDVTSQGSPVTARGEFLESCAMVDRRILARRGFVGLVMGQSPLGHYFTKFVNCLL
jgi:hypothetical protein